jgi:TonB family protein
MCRCADPFVKASQITHKIMKRCQYAGRLFQWGGSAARLALICWLAFLIGGVARAQFQIVGPAPISPAVARQRIRALLESVNAANLQETNRQLNSLINWYRELMDDEIVAAWQREGRSNLPPLVETWADARVAAGIVDYSWRQQRATTFIPEYEHTLGLLMTRYPDTTKNIFDDLLGQDGRPPADLSQTEAETVCRIFLDLPDIRDFRQKTLQILPRYRQIAERLIETDAHANERERNYKADRWLADLAAARPNTNAVRQATQGTSASKGAPLSGQSTADSKGREALELFNAKQYEAARAPAKAGAAAGSALSMYVLGRIAAAENGTGSDIEAATWFRKAAGAGWVAAMVELGSLYQSGRGVDQDFVEAAHWYRSAAEKSDSAGMAALGRLYEIGGGVEQDYAQASQWYIKGAQAGSPAAMVSLGLMYENGHAIDASGKPGRQDLSEAMTWYAKAASFGDAVGMYRLASSYEIGKGVTPNPLLAMEWYRRATAAGSEPARARLAIVGGSMAADPDRLLQDAREAARKPIGSFPDFTAYRTTTRFTARGIRGPWKTVTTVSADVIFQNGRESLRNWSVNGMPPGRGGPIIPGWMVSGIVGTVSGLMAAETKASFRDPRPEKILGREAIRYDYAVEQLTSNWFVAGGGESYRAAYSGSVWIDAEKRAALRVDMTAHDLAADFALDSAVTQIDYDSVVIGGQSLMMPVKAERVTCARATGECTREVDVFQYGPASASAAPSGTRPEDGVTAPVPVHRVQAEYSDEGKRTHRSGVVKLSVLVDTQGNPRDIQVVEALGMGLDEKAVEAVRQWKFRPGMKNGRLADVRVTLEVTFQIR